MSSTSTPRTIALVATAAGLLCACGIPVPLHQPPPPPDMVSVSAENLIRQPTPQEPTQRFMVTFQNLVNFPVAISAPRLMNHDPAFTITKTCPLTLPARGTCDVIIDATNTTGKPLVEFLLMSVDRSDRYESHGVRLYLKPLKDR